MTIPPTNRAVFGLLDTRDSQGNAGARRAQASGDQAVIDAAPSKLEFE